VEKVDNAEFPEVKIYRSSVVRFMQYFFGDLLDTKVRENWRRYDEYFECLRDFTTSSFLATSFMIQRQEAILRVLEFIMNNKVPFSSSKTKMGQGNFEHPKINQTLDLLCYLVRSTYTSGIDGLNEYPDTSVFQGDGDNHKLSLPPSDVTFLLKKECLNELISLCGEDNSDETKATMASLLTHLSWGDNNVSQFFISTMIEYIKKQVSTISNTSSGQPKLPAVLDVAFKIVTAFMTMQDGDLKAKRFGFFFDLKNEYVNTAPIFNSLHAEATRHPRFVLLVLAFLSGIALDDDQLLAYLRENHIAYSEWVIAFLEQHCAAAKSLLQPSCKETLVNTTRAFYQILQLEREPPQPQIV
jgi:hypothetical protein